ncbi:MAG TPA: rhomboid family intramembrane serine protease [Thermoanaerobaculia bacterium]|jgi:rhomboid protease GluP|nr:rhomboid family intramembrane serine protease [Thermoanaerobaculia bacterium]
MNERPSTPATYLITLAILFGFVVEVYTGAWRNSSILTEIGAIEWSRVVHDGEYWRLLSAMFLHGDGTIRGDLLHLGMNLFALWQLGRLYEMMFGTRRFVFIYFSTGLFASLTSLLRQAGPSVGASGAIFGILGAFIFSIRRSPRFRHERWARGIVSQLMFWIVANIVIGFTIPQIDMAAHLGGLAAGLLLGATLPQKEPPIPPSQGVIDVTPQ